MQLFDAGIKSSHLVIRGTMNSLGQILFLPRCVSLRVRIGERKRLPREAPAQQRGQAPLRAISERFKTGGRC